MTGSCIRCGGPLGDFDAGGDMICANCEARGSGHGGGTDVPCQRCGMYLPPHELRMWNSRLYCAYCIMDIQDEERYGKEKRAPVAEQPQQGGILDSLMRHGGACERCGRQVSLLYSVSGRRVCESCHATMGGAPGGGFPTLFGGLVQVVQERLGIRKKEPPKIVVAQKIAAPPIVKGAQPEKVFDVYERRMVEKKEGVEAKRPLAEEKHAPKEGRKPMPKVKKSFFWAGKGTTEETKGRSADEDR